MTANQTVINLIGGVVLLLWGTRLIRTGVMRGFGGQLRDFLSMATDNRFKATAFGTIIGTLLQSSTATAVLTSSFVSRGALSLVPALAVMLGADLGASIAAQIFSAGISGLWGIMVIVGYVLFVLFESKQSAWHYIGRIFIGLGFALLALRLIGMSADQVRDNALVQTIVIAASSQMLISITVGALLVWVMYSSLAAILLVASLAATEVVVPGALFGLVLGINLGAALPALSATMGESVLGRRVPLGNLIFRILAVALAAPVVHFAEPLLSAISTDPLRQIINLHMLFNIGLCLVLIWAVGPVAALARSLLPTTIDENSEWAPRNLDDSSLETPAVALGMAARETLRMGDVVEDMLVKTMRVLDQNDIALCQQVIDLDDHVDRLHEAIKLYLTRLSRQQLAAEDSQRCVDIITFTTNLEHVGDIVEKNLMVLAEKKATDQLSFSDEGMQELTQMHDALMDTLRLCLSVFMSQNLDDARSLLARKDQFRELELTGTEQHLQRLRSGQPQSIATSALHLDMVRDFKRINSHLTSVSYPILSRAGALHPSRLRKHKSDN